jgi:hypothetical protein
MAERPQDEAQFLSRVHAQLDQSVVDLDPETRARLAQARRQAVAQISKPRRLPQPVAMLALAASVVVMVAGISLLLPVSNPALPAIDAKDMAMLTTGEDFELLEDLDFYRWLEDTEQST